MLTKDKAKEMLDQIEQFGLHSWVQVNQLVAVVRYLVESLPDAAIEEDIYIPSSAIVSGPIKVTSVEVVQPMPFDMGLDD